MTVVTQKNMNLPIKLFFVVIFGIFLYLSSLYSYLLFHSIVEGFSIVIAFCIFLIAWNSRRVSDNIFFIFLGIAYLFIGSIDFIHTLGYTGMSIFIGYGTNLPTQLWITARYLESISILMASIILGRKKRFSERFHFLIIGLYFISFCILIMSIFSGFFPDCFIEGSGLTHFKIISEYIIMAILFACIVFLIHKREMFDTTVFSLIIAAILTTIAAEFCFTLYGNDPYGLFNQTGHFLKILSFYIIYNALIVTSLHGSFNTLIKDLQQSRNELLISEKRRSAFIGMTTHELRTPITVIKGYSEFLDRNLENIESIRQFQAFESISQNVVRLERLIKGITDITRMEQGIFELSPEVTDLSQLLERFIGSYKELYRNKFSINGIMDFKTPILLNIDSDRIGQVLDNLMDNANKHTNTDGRIVLTTNVSPNTVQITIVDTGVGILPDNIERIFDQFVSFTTDRAVGGTGIGLYISRAICEAHGGKLTAHSMGKDQGATFAIELPRWFE